MCQILQFPIEKTKPSFRQESTRKALRAGWERVQWQHMCYGGKDEKVGVSIFLDVGKPCPCCGAKQ